MRMHVAVQVTAVVDIDADDLENMRYALAGMRVGGGSYLDDGKGGQTRISPTLLRVMELSAAQVVMDAVHHNLKEDLDRLTTDVTLANSAAPGAKA